jgi:hypothetical protein
VVEGEVAPAAQKAKEELSIKASEERTHQLLATIAAAIPLVVLAMLRSRS